MWRGVPMANYVNEVNFRYLQGGWRFWDAPTFFNPLLPLGLWVGTLNSLIPTTVPSMEVMASDSPWLSQLIHQAYDPYGSGNAAHSTESRHPFQFKADGFAKILQCLF